MFTVRYSAAVSRNHIRLTNVETGETVAKASLQPFSSQDHLIADAKIAALFLGDLIRDAEGRRRWFRFLPSVDVTLIGGSKAQEDLSEVRRLFLEQGFVRVRVT